MKIKHYSMFKNLNSLIFVFYYMPHRHKYLCGNTNTDLIFYTLNQLICASSDQNNFSGKRYKWKNRFFCSLIWCLVSAKTYVL